MRPRSVHRIIAGLGSAYLTGAVMWAYVDPTAGGALISILLAGAAGPLILGRLLWARIRRGRRATGSAAEEGADHRTEQP